MTDAEELKAYKRMSLVDQAHYFERINQLERIVPTECCVCLEPMSGRSLRYGWACSSDCAGEHYD